MERDRMEQVLLERIDRMAQLDLRYTLDGSAVEIVWFRALRDRNAAAGHWHAHTNPEIHYMYAEDMTVSFGADEVVIPAGHALLIGPGAWHSLGALGDRTRIRFVLSFNIQPADDEDMQRVAAALSSRDRYLFKVDGTLERLFIACLGEATERQPGFLNILKANVLEILTRIARLLPAENAEARVSVPIRQRVDDRRAQQIAEYVERGACHNLTVADMARLMNLSEKQIQRIVSKRFGTSVHRMVMEAKLRAAKEMLKSPQYTLEQIATALGFASEQYFNRFFRRMEGMPPHRYRKSIIP